MEHSELTNLHTAGRAVPGAAAVRGTSRAANIRPRALWPEPMGGKAWSGGPLSLATLVHHDGGLGWEVWTEGVCGVRGPKEGSCEQRPGRTRCCQGRGQLGTSPDPKYREGGTRGRGHHFPPRPKTAPQQSQGWLAGC